MKIYVVKGDLLLTNYQVEGVFKSRHEAELLAKKKALEVIEFEKKSGGLHDDGDWEFYGYLVLEFEI